MVISVYHIPPFSSLEAIRGRWFRLDLCSGAVALSLTFVIGIGMSSSSSLSIETQLACHGHLWSADNFTIG